jgi:hypothetical protein
MRFHQAVWIVALALFLGGIAQAGYVSSIQLECAAVVGGIIETTVNSGSLSAICPNNANINAFVEASGSTLRVAIDQPGYSHVWDTAIAEVDDAFSITSPGMSGPGILRFTATISATTTAASWPSDAYVYMAIQETVGWGMCGWIDVDTEGPRNCTFDQPFTFGADGSFKLELVGVVKGRGSVDASHTATYQIAGVYLPDGTTPVTDFSFASGSGERYGLAPLDSSVPEPATIVLLGFPLLLMALVRLRRREQGGTTLPVLSEDGAH